MRQPVDDSRLRAFMRELGRRAAVPARVYLVGGASAVLEGWRQTTVDVDVRLVPDGPLLSLLPGIKRDLDLNVELAAPDEFIPALPGWEARSRFIVREGSVDFFHYDFYAQALAKVERDLAHDAADVAEMVGRGLVRPAQARALFDVIEPELYRFPAIDPATFRARVFAAFG